MRLGLSSAKRGPWRRTTRASPRRLPVPRRYPRAVVGRARHRFTAREPRIRPPGGGLQACLRLAGRKDKVPALATFRHLIAEFPDHGECHRRFGGLLLVLGRCEEAVVAYRWALALNPVDADVQTNLGVALHRLGRFEEACAAFDAALDLAPGSVAAYYNLGCALGDLGRRSNSLPTPPRASLITLVPTGAVPLPCSLWTVSRRAGWGMNGASRVRACSTRSADGSSIRRAGTARHSTAGVYLSIASRAWATSPRWPATSAKPSNRAGPCSSANLISSACLTPDSIVSPRS